MCVTVLLLAARKQVLAVLGDHVLHYQGKGECCWRVKGVCMTVILCMLAACHNSEPRHLHISEPCHLHI